MHAELRRLANSQGGIFTGTQARRFHRWSEIAGFWDAGTIERVGHRTFSLVTTGGGAVVVDDLPSRIRAAETLVGRPVIACLYTAAALLGFGVIGSPQLHLMTENGWSKVVPSGIVLHQMKPRGETTSIDGVVATDPADTAIDVACAVSEMDQLAVLDAACRFRNLAVPELTTAVDRAYGRRGLAGVRLWVPFAIASAESPMESRTRFRIIAAGLPPPESQIEIRTAGDDCRYLDMGWQRYRIGVDYEGEEFHTGTGAMSRDRQRHNALTHENWRMFYPTSPDVYRNHRNFTDMLGVALTAAGWRPPQ